MIKPLFYILLSSISCFIGTSAAQQFGFPFPVLSDEPPYYHVRYPASQQPGELNFAANYTVWIPPQVTKIRAVIVHQHGCGPGAAYTGLTGAFDLHWQALAKQHDAALLSAAYEQPKGKPCPNWAEPRNGSETVFLKALKDLSIKSAQAELASAPWALWGHSGGAVWAGGMTFLHPKRVAAVWMRSGVIGIESDSKPAAVGKFSLTAEVLTVPMMLNQGAKEGITDTSGRFAHVWPRNKKVFHTIRAKGGLIAHSSDLLSEHNNGNQRYLAIPWFNTILESRLSKNARDTLKPMPAEDIWLAPLMGIKALPAAEYKGDKSKAVWLPNKHIAEAWMSYMQDNTVADTTPPPAPTDIVVEGTHLSWNAEADLESGLAYFIIERDGKFLAKVQDSDTKMKGRALFQRLYNSDSPRQPLPEMRFNDSSALQGKAYSYKVIAVNTVGLQSN
jgi:hypothetical protein